MKPTHIILIVMGVLIAVIGVTALAGPPIMRMLGGGGSDGRITIAIATEPMLEGFREAAEEQVAIAQGTAPQQPAPGSEVAQAVTSGAGTTPAAPNTSAPQTEEARQHVEAASWVRALQNSLRDALGNELAQRLIDSRRFEVRDSSQFMSALDELNRREASGDTGQSIFSIFQRNSSKQTTSAPGVETETQSEGGATLQTVASAFSNDDLRGAGRALGADYVLVIAVTQGSYRHEHTYDPYSTTMNHDNRWEPTIIFRVFNVSTGNVTLARQVPLTPAIVVRDEGQGSEQIANEFRLQLNDRVASMVTADVLAVLAPARVVSAGDTLTINRGSRDGVREGQVYEVEREDVGGVRDVNYNAETGRTTEGVTLEPIRERVGQLRILTVQDNIATAAPVEGTLARGDIVVITPSTTRALTIANTGSGGGGDDIPLGEGQAAQAGARASLAVGDIRVELLEPPTWRRPESPGMLLSRGIAGQLANSGQVNVLTRADIERLRQERQLMARSQGVEDANVDLGMDTAGNLLTGEIQISGTRAGPTVSVGGQSRQTSTASRLIATGTLRVQTVGGRTIYSVPVRTERPGSAQNATDVNNLIDAVSADAAAALLVRMFPIRVVSVSGTSVVLNRGHEAGLRVGARLAAYRVDAATRTRQRLGELVVTDAAPGYNASARFAAQPFATTGTVEVEILSGGAAPQARPARASNNNAAQEPQAAPVQW